MASPEFSRIVRMDEIGPAPRTHKIDADAGERDALVVRFGLSHMSLLTAEIALSREAGGVRARGMVEARLDQLCVVSGQPVPASLREPVDVLYSRDVGSAGDEEEIELAAGDCDVLELEGERVDIGELAAETVFLALDPYPRLNDEALTAYRRLLLSEEEALKLTETDKADKNPFAVLKQKRD